MPEAVEVTTRQHVAATSDEFLRRFVDIWILFAIVLWIFLFTTTPDIQYPALVMLAAGLPARLAIRAGRPQWARYLIVAPAVVAVTAAPLFLNGVRTPVIANMSMILLLAGWMLGRRALAFLTALFVFVVALYWLSEAAGWLVPSVPLRLPHVWAMTWGCSLALTGIVIWSLIGNYEADFGREMESQRQRAEALARAEAANRKLTEALNFNETILLNSPLPMGVYAAGGQCVEVNDAIAKLVGGAREDLLAQNFRSIRAWRTTGLLDGCLAALAHDSPQQRECQVMTSFGKEVWLDCHILPIHLNGEPHLLIQFFDLTERKRIEDELRDYAFHDSLTKLPNRRLLRDRLERAARASKRQNSYMAVLFVDLDKFKQLNDAYGHDVGDRALIEVADRLRRAVRASDTVARLSGDEFVVLLEGLGPDPDAAADYAKTVAAAIGGALSEEYVLGEIRLHNSASIGTKLFLGARADPDAILREADAAMYAMKRSAA
jgi:diguanylate cyclase (GGDEF)-like protein/PAS domain S-box-containing protein